METTKKAYVSNKDESPVLFKNPLLEKLTKVHPATPVILFAPVVTYFFYQALELNGFSWGNVLVQFFAGLLFWTVFEYSLHRYIFHLTPENSIGKKLVYLFHGIHHDYPKDSWRLVMPPVVSIILSSLLYLAYEAILPASSVDGFFSGFMLGYIFYDSTHFLVHHYNFTNRWFLMLRNHHFVHHYQDQQSNYGVSSPLWDLIIRTNRK